VSVRLAIAFIGYRVRDSAVTAIALDKGLERTTVFLLVKVGPIVGENTIPNKPPARLKKLLTRNSPECADHKIGIGDNRRVYMY